MTVTVTEITQEKLKHTITDYRDYKNFCNDRFRQILLEKLCTENISTSCSGMESFSKFALIH